MNEDLPIVEYTPGSQIRTPGKLFKSMWHDLKASRGLAWRLFVRDFSAKYRQTALGYLWAFLPPLVTTFVWVFLNDQKVFNVGETGIPYPAYVLMGTLLWQVFVDATRAPLEKVTASRSMLTKINFPREAILIAGLGEVIFNFLIRLILFLGIFLYYDLPLTGSILLLPIGIMSLMLLGTMIGILLTPVGLLYRDVGNALTMGLQFWFYLTPVIYPMPTEGLASKVAKFNPVSPLIEMCRSWLTGGSIDSLIPFVIISVLSLVFLFLGWLLYRLALPHLIERMSA